MVDKKVCCRCKEELSVEQFKSNKRKKDGLQAQCIECQREYRREHYLKNKQKYIDKAKDWRNDFVSKYKDYKRQFSCAECGESHPACIQFHHHNDDKEDSVSKLAVQAYSQRAFEEIDKCTPLCANCHAKVHWKE